MLPASSGDLRVRPPTLTDVPRHVPRNIPSQVVWDIIKVESLPTLSTSTITETNFSFSLSNHPSATSYTNLYDQWTIPQFSVSFVSLSPPGQTTTVPRVYTALDFDNVSTGQTVATLEDFSTCRVQTLEPGKSIVRSILPCIKLTTATGASAVPTRSWVDSATPAQPFFGIRSIATQIGNAQPTQPLLCVATIVFAFRNQI
jgi:hypothetical protein